MWGILVAMIWPMLRWLAALPFLYFILTLYTTQVQPAINFLLHGMMDLNQQLISGQGGSGADYGLAIVLLNFLALPQAIGLYVSAMSFAFLFRIVVLSAKYITKKLPASVK